MPPDGHLFFYWTLVTLKYMLSPNVPAGVNCALWSTAALLGLSLPYIARVGVHVERRCSEEDFGENYETTKLKLWDTAGSSLLHSKTHSTSS